MLIMEGKSFGCVHLRAVNVRLYSTFSFLARNTSPVRHQIEPLEELKLVNIYQRFCCAAQYTRQWIGAGQYQSPFKSMRVHFRVLKSSGTALYSQFLSKLAVMRAPDRPLNLTNLAPGAIVFIRYHVKSVNIQTKHALTGTFLQNCQSSNLISTAVHFLVSPT